VELYMEAGEVSLEVQQVLWRLGVPCQKGFKPFVREGSLDTPYFKAVKGKPTDPSFERVYGRLAPLMHALKPGRDYGFVRVRELEYDDEGWPVFYAGMQPVESGPEVELWRANAQPRITTFISNLV
jgi:hypothetical protein